MNKIKDLHIIHTNNNPEHTGKKWLIILTIIAFILSLVVMFGNNIINFFSGNKIKEPSKDEHKKTVDHALDAHMVVDDVIGLDIMDF